MDIEVEENEAIVDDEEFAKEFAALTAGEPDDEYEEVDDGDTEEVAPEQDAEQADDDEAASEAVGDSGGEEPASGSEVADKSGSPEQDADYWRHKYQSDAGRVSALQKKVNELQAQLETKPQEKPVVQSDSAKAFSELKEDFPEIANAVQGYVDEIVAQKTAEVSQRVKETVAPLEKEQQDRFWKSQFEALDSAHPDWKDVVESTEFNRWVDQQPQGIQDLKRSDYASDVASVINYFKSATGPVNRADPEVEALRKRREKQLEDATTVVSKGPGERKAGTPSDFDNAFAHYANKRGR